MLKLYLCTIHFMLYIYDHDEVSSTFIYIKLYLSQLSLFIMSIRVRVRTLEVLFGWIAFNLYIQVALIKKPLFLSDPL